VFPEAGRAIARADVATRVVKSITHDMLQGKAQPKTNTTDNYRGLVITHGYCSPTNPWVGRAGDFSGNFGKFLRANANQPTDVFAQLVLTYGNNNFDTYGHLGHSQGGMVGAHIYTYYNTGMDDATGGFQMQSVGTPYMGCPMAGLLARIGDIFGVGCGINNDLTYDGARRWLAGIPQSTRSRITYVTTQYSLNPLVRYCSLAANIVLKWPNDGVTEVEFGQLNGARNHGNVPDWCHTESMRYPHQCKNAGLNRFFNTNSAR